MIDYKKIITDTVSNKIKNSVSDTVLKTMNSATAKATRMVKSKIGYTLYLTDDPDLDKINALIKRLNPTKYKENSVYRATSRGFRREKGETLNNSVDFTIKVPNAKAYIKFYKKYGESMDVFVYGPDAKTVYKLLLVYMNKESNANMTLKLKSKSTCRVFTIDVDQDGDFFVKGGGKAPAKTLGTIYTDKANKEKISNYLSKWKQSSNLFKDLNISYKLGILLYGPPGTGKTSMVKAISSLLEYDIYSVNMSRFTSNIISDIKSMAEEQEGMIILLEDIDYIFGKREKEFTQEEKARSNSLLQLLDGAQSMPNVVFIATTNDIGSLDEAIIRDGRFDLKINMDNIDRSLAEEMCEGLYLNSDQTEELLSNETFPINPAYLQNKIIQYIFSHIESMDYKREEDDENEYVCSTF